MYNFAKWHIILICDKHDAWLQMKTCRQIVEFQLANIKEPLVVLFYNLFHRYLTAILKTTFKENVVQ